MLCLTRRIGLRDGTVTAYAVRNDKNGYPQFLIYESNQWKWVSAKNFKPCDGEPESYVISIYE